MAGAEEQTPVMSTSQLVKLIVQAGRVPVERDTLYNEIRNYSAKPLVEGEKVATLSS